MSANGIKPSLRRRQLVDDSLLAYVEWREECTEVWDAYSRWSNAPVADAPCACAAYQAALDREEAAAKIYADLLARVHYLAETGLDHPVALRGSL